jgi:uncharacterized RDD family membrane protein YckC
MYWIAHVTKSNDGATLTIIQSRGIGGQGPWKRIAQPGGKVVSLASRDNELAVLLESGDWMLVWDGGSSSGELPQDGAKLLELAGSKQTLWAIAAAGQGRAPASAPATTEPATTMPAGTLLLYRLERGQWQQVAPLPPQAAGAVDLALGVDDDVPRLAVLATDRRIETYVFNAESQTWESTGSVNPPENATRVKYLQDLGSVTIWAGNDLGAGVLFSRKPEWSPGIALAPQASSIAAADIAVAGQSIRLVTLAQGADKLLETSFLPDGTARGNPAELSLPKPSATDTRTQDWLHIVAAAMLLMVLFNSLRVPRPVIDPDALDEAGVVLAPFGRRFLAALIDAVPIVATILILMPRNANTDPESLLAFATAIRVPQYIATGVYLFHTTLTEVLWGWTVGKRLMGLQVASLDGGEPSRPALFWRNVLRLIDAAMVITALLVFISPLRQRVGDVAAETIVILRRRTEPVTEPPAEEQAVGTETRGQGDKETSGSER